MSGMSFYFFKPKTAYEMRMSDGSSDVCSSDLVAQVGGVGQVGAAVGARRQLPQKCRFVAAAPGGIERNRFRRQRGQFTHRDSVCFVPKIGRASCRESVCKYG